MALVICSECGHDVSEYAYKCPKCGCKNQDRSEFDTIDIFQLNYEEQYFSYIKQKNIDYKKKIEKRNIMIKRALLSVTLITFIVCGVVFFKDKMYYISQKNEIDKAAKFLGCKVDKTGTVYFDDDEEEIEPVRGEVDLFDIEGYIYYGITESSQRVDVMDWRSTQEFNDDIGRIVDELEKLYGDFETSAEFYDGLDNMFLWKDVEKYDWIICGIDNATNRLVVYWVLK